MTVKATKLNVIPVEVKWIKAFSNLVLKNLFVILICLTITYLLQSCNLIVKYNAHILMTFKALLLHQHEYLCNCVC